MAKNQENPSFCKKTNLVTLQNLCSPCHQQEADSQTYGEPRQDDTPYYVHTDDKVSARLPFLPYKMTLFRIVKKPLKMLQNQQFFLSLQKYDRIMSPRSLSPKFSLVLKIPAFKLRCFHFYLIKGPFFPIFNFGPL